MRKLLLMLAMSACTGGATPAFAQADIHSYFPPQSQGFVTDWAHVVRRPDELAILLRKLRYSDTLYLNIVALPTTGPYDIADVAREIGRTWKVAFSDDTLGSVLRNTGGVILLVTDSHKCRVEVAQGSEGYMTDSHAADLCRASAPYFRTGNFDEGFMRIAQGFASAHQAALAEPRATGGPVVDNPPTPHDDDSGVPWVLILTIGVVVVVGRLVIRRMMCKAKAAEEQRLWAEAQREREAAAARQAEIDAAYAKATTPRRPRRRRRQPAGATNNNTNVNVSRQGVRDRTIIATHIVPPPLVYPVCGGCGNYTNMCTCAGSMNDDTFSASGFTSPSSASVAMDEASTVVDDTASSGGSAAFDGGGGGSDYGSSDSSSSSDYSSSSDSSSSSDYSSSSDSGSSSGFDS